MSADDKTDAVYWRVSEYDEKEGVDRAVGAVRIVGVEETPAWVENVGWDGWVGLVTEVGVVQTVGALNLVFALNIGENRLVLVLMLVEELDAEVWLSVVEVEVG